jgi:hypothetical protein
MAVRIHQAEGLLGDGGAGAREQALLELDERRLDPLIAMGGEAIHHRLDRAGLDLGIGGQKVPQAGGQKRRVRRQIVGHLRVSLPGIGRERPDAMRRRL